MRRQTGCRHFLRTNAGMKSFGLLTDDVFLADFTQTLGRYASTLFPQQESLLDFEAPVIDFFEYSDADAEHIVKAVLLAKSLGLLTVGKAELGDDPVRFQIPGGCCNPCSTVSVRRHIPPFGAGKERRSHYRPSSVPLAG